jgi:hypothetical protein
MPSTAGGQSPTPAFGIEALSYHAPSNTLYAVYMIPTAHTAHGRLVVAAIKPETGEALWRSDISQCTGLASDLKIMPGFGRGGSSVYLTCVTGVSETETSHVLKIDALATGATRTIEQFDAPGNATRAIFMPSTERMFLVLSETLAVFDGAHEVWLGLVPKGSRVHVGMNPISGRVYLCGSSQIDPFSHKPVGGMLITDAGLATPAPPGTEYPEIGCDSDSQAYPMAVDTKTSRLYVPARTPTGGGARAVVHDGVLPYEEAPRFDPDAGTADVPEREGTTDSTWATQAAAFGTRIVWVGGPMGTLDNSTVFLPAVIRQNGYQLSLRVSESSREVRFAYVTGAKLSGNGTQAIGLSAWPDDRFESDFQTLRNYDFQGLKNQTGQPAWPYTPSVCYAFGGATDKPQDSKNQDGGTSSATCDFAKKIVKAEARSKSYSVEPSESAPLLRVGDSSADVSLTRDPAKGIVAVVHSVARNVVVAGKVFIAETASTLTVRASGHKKLGRIQGADATYERSFSGVKILGADGKAAFSCASPADCDKADLVGKMNAVLGPRIKAFEPQPDPELINGSDKGTAASLRQNFWEQLEEQVLYDKPPEDLTMPAITFQVNASVRANSGAIVQLAGVTASSIYQIFLKPPEGCICLPPGPTVLPKIVVPCPTCDLGGKPIPPTSKTITRQIIEKLRYGVRMAFGIPARPASILAAWALLMAPLYVGIRRRMYLTRTHR